MAKGDPARGSKGHVICRGLDTNDSSMTTCAWRPSGEGAQEALKRGEERTRRY